MGRYKKFLILITALLLVFSSGFCFAKGTEQPLINKEQSLLESIQNDKIRIFFVDPTKNRKPKNVCENDASISLLALIENAKESIDFAIYGIGGQDEIFNALVNAKKRGVRVQGIVDMDSNNTNPYSDTEELIKELQTVKTDYKELQNFTPLKNDYLQQVEYIINGEKISAAFVNKGIKDYNEAIMHDKYFIIDEKYVYTGSMNISSSCANYNANNSVVIESKELAQLFLDDFNQMYSQQKFHKEKSKIDKNHTVELDNGTVITAFLLPEDRGAYYEISKYIKNAKKYIYVPMFFFTHSKYPQDLIDAHNRGIDVRVIVDATSARTGYSKHEILRMAKIPVKIENWGGKMHMKSMIIDDEYILIGSMNFTSGAHYTNDENSLLIKNERIAKEFREYFNYLWNSIPDKWLTGIPKPEGRDSKYSCCDGIDNDHDGLKDKYDPDCHIINFRSKKKPKIFIQEGPNED